MKYIIPSLFCIIFLAGCNDEVKLKTYYLNQCSHLNDSIHYLIEMSEITNRTYDLWNLKLDLTKKQIENLGFIRNYSVSDTLRQSLLSYISNYIKPCDLTYNHEKVLLYNDSCRGSIDKIIMRERLKLPN